MSMLYRVTALLTICVVGCLAALTVFSGSSPAVARTDPDHVRLLDRVETAAVLETPWSGILRARAAAAPVAPEWLALEDRGGVLASLQRDPHGGPPMLRPEAGAFALTWTTPVVAERAYRIKLRVGVKPGDSHWSASVDEGRIAATLRPTIRFETDVAATARLVATKSFESASPPAKPAVTGDDPFAPLREAARLVAADPALREALWKQADSGRQLATAEVTIDFTPPAGTTAATIRLDAAGVVGPFALGLECARHTREAGWAEAMAGKQYRFAGTHGITARVKRMVETPREDRLCLLLPPPATIGFDVAFPAGAELVFGVRGLPPLGGEAVVPSRLVVEAEIDGVVTALHEETVSLPRAAAGRWDERRVDCAAVAGRTGRLSIRVVGQASSGTQTASGTQVALADPILHRRGRRSEIPSIILLTVDSLRHDVVGLKVDGQSLTPRIDRLVAESTRVSHAIAGGLNTYTSVPCMVTATPVLTPGAGRSAERPPPELPTIAEALADAGRFVGAFIPDYYMNSFLKGVSVRPRTEGHDDTDRVDRALRFLERHPEDPVFLWVHLDDPHLPWIPTPAQAPVWDIPGVPDPGRDAGDARFLAAARALLSADEAVRVAGRRYLRAAFHAETRRADNQVGRFLDGLERLGRQTNTILALHADHGVVVEGERIGRRDFRDGTIRVPLIIRYPGVLPGGEVRRGVLGMEDLAPTLLGLAGVDRPSAWYGRERTGWLRGLEPHRPAVEESYLRDGWAAARHLGRAVVRTLDWRLEIWLGDDGKVTKSQLFDARDGADPERDVAAEHPEVVRGLRERFLRIMHEAGDRFATGPLSSAMKRFLREAGYLPETGEPK